MTTRRVSRRQPGICILIVFALLFIQPAWAPGVRAATARAIPAEVFGQLPQVESPRFSPDGKYLAMIRPVKGLRHVVVQPANGKGVSAAIPPVDKLEIAWFAWANNDRLLVSLKLEGFRRAVPTLETRLIAVNKDGSNPTYIVRPKVLKAANSRLRGTKIYAQIQDDVIDYLWQDPDHILLSVDSDRNGEDEVRRIDIRTGEYREIGLDFKGIQSWYTDADGTLRLGSGFYQSSRRMLYRSPATGKWQNFTDSAAYQNGLRPLAIAESPELLYMGMTNKFGTRSIVKYDAVAERVVEVVFEHETYSAGGLIEDPLTHRPVGIYYIDDRPHIRYFDAARQRRQRVLDKALPNTFNQIVSRTADDRLYIVLATSDTEPGVYYVFDRPNKKLYPMVLRYKGLDPEVLSPMKRITYRARDGLEIPAYLTLPKGREAKNLPVVVFPHGGPHARDFIDFDYVTQFLASRGYAVLQPNFRGSSGYTVAFRDAGKRNWGLKMQDDVTDGVKWLIDEGIADPRRICIVGASYGGYAALIGAVKTPDLYRCAVSINGVANLKALIYEDKRYIGGSAWTKSIGDPGKDAQILKDTSPAYQVDKIRAPILLIHAKDDRRVPYWQSRGMAKSLRKAHKRAEFVELKNGGHTLDTEAARVTTLKALERFLAQNLGHAG